MNDDNLGMICDVSILLHDVHSHLQAISLNGVYINFFLEKRYLPIIIFYEILMHACGVKFWLEAMFD